jgi:hypothetical protein
MQCSVCGASAINMTPGDFDGLVVSCPHCGDYEVTGTVMNQFLRMTLTERKDALEDARRQTPQGHKPAITSASF